MEFSNLSTHSEVRKGVTPSDVHVNRPLTNISVAYMQNPANFVAARIFPVVPVSKQSDIFYTYNRGDWNRNEMKKRAPATESAGGTYGLGQDTYFADVYAVHMDVPDQLRANADEQINVDRDATAWVSQKGLLFRENAWVDNFFKAGVWTTQKTGIPTGVPTAAQFLQWNDAASEPAKDVKRWKDEILQKTGVIPNVLVLGHKTYTILTENDSIVDRVKYGQTPNGPAVVTRQALAALFEVDRIEVLSSLINSGVEGGAEVNNFTAAPTAAGLFYAAPSPGLLQPSAGYTFSWSGYLGANSEGGRVSTIRMELLKADRVELELSFSPKKVADDLGIFAVSAVAGT